MLFITGTGLQIPPAAQQALQMSGSLAFGAVAGKNLTLSYFSQDVVLKFSTKKN